MKGRPHVETTWDVINQRWGVSYQGQPVPGTFEYDDEMGALNRARRDFPHDSVWITRDSYHSSNRGSK